MEDQEDLARDQWRHWVSSRHSISIRATVASWPEAAGGQDWYRRLIAGDF